MIAAVLEHYYPRWQPPRDSGREWVSCLCPSHEETRPSAAVSYRLDAVACLACGFKGSAISIVMREEGISYQEAIKRAASISGRSRKTISRELRRKSGRIVFGGTGVSGGQDQTVPVWLRG